MKTIYLDNQASTAIDERVWAAMAAAGHGNPHASEHSTGWDAARKVETARASVAALIGADPDEIFFTSGATESNNLAILGIRNLRKEGRDIVLHSRIEHKSVLAACEALAEEHGYEVAAIPVHNDGTVDVSGIRDEMLDRTALISVAYVNNEIGTIQDIASINGMKEGALFHCDAAQAPEAVDLGRAADNCDLLSLSAHKMRGPMGIGALYIARNVQQKVKPIMFGGGQQSGIRPGTLPLHLCVGMGVACEIARSDSEGRKGLAERRDRFLAALKAQGVVFHLNGVKDSTRRHPGNANIRLEGVDAEQLIALLQPHVAASTGSACTSGELEPSYVLTAIGLTSDEAAQSIRFSLGAQTNDSELVEATKLIASTLSKLV